MPIEMNEQGDVYHSHELVSPLDSETLLSTCVQCHEDTDMKEKVRRVQARVTAREKEVGNRLSEFKTLLAKAVSEGKTSEDTLNKIRKLHREAQWFFDFCYVENSEGAHNSDLSIRCLDLSEARIAEGMSILSGN